MGPLRLCLCLYQLVLTFAWQGSSGPISIFVDQAFRYDVYVRGVVWLQNGRVTLQCGGISLASDNPNALLINNKTSEVEGIDERLGRWHGIQTSWKAAAKVQESVCGGGITTTIRQYVDQPDAAAFEFVTQVDALVALAGTGICTSTCFNVSTGFPSLDLPGKGANVGFVSWNGMMLSSTFQHSLPPADWGTWLAGIYGGPLVLYSAEAGVVLGSSSNFKDGMLVNTSRLQSRAAQTEEVSEVLGVTGGVQGMVQQLPANYSLRFALVSCQRAPCGVTGAMLNFGSFLRWGRQKLSLAEDVLSSRLHYLTDGGSLETYCDYWPMCEKSHGGPGCTPQGEVFKQLDAYHRSIGLHIGVYHVDPYWFYETEVCNGAVDAHQWTPSPFHFPKGIQDVGVPMMLFLQSFESTSVYNTSFRFEGGSVCGSDSRRFFREIFGKMYATGFFKALTLDGVADVWLSSALRLMSVGEQQMYDEGLAHAAFELGLPIRIDRAFPSDILASTQYGARTVHRCTTDQDPWTSIQAGLYRDLGGNALLVRAMGARPMVDVLWTVSNQTDPRWGTKGVCKPNVQHDIISAVLSTGPVGFGDRLNRTNVSLLSRATRADGIILKPASAALRLDRFYDAHRGGAEIWAAPTQPGTSDPRTDPVANSMAALESASSPDALRGWMILATNVDGGVSGAPVATSELWPPPAEDAQFLVAQLEHRSPSQLRPPCSNGSLVADCLFRWSFKSPLPVATGDTSFLPGCVSHNFTLLSAAPVLANGWALLGDLRQFVPVSPQRFAREVAVAAEDPEDLSFRVLGVPGEVVPVSVATPAQRIWVLDVHVGQEGTAVRCRNLRCVQGDRPSFFELTLQGTLYT